MVDFLLTCLMCVVVGVALRACKHPPEATHLLRDLILKVALPATVLVALLGADIEWSWLLLPAFSFSWGLVVLLGALSWFATTGRHVPPPQRRTLLVMLPSAAPAMATFPFIAAALGPEGLAQASVAHLGFLVVSIAGARALAAFLAAEAGGGTRAEWGDALKRIALEPVAVTVLLAALLRAAGIEAADLPPAVAGFLATLTDLLTPLVLFYVALAFRFEAERVRLILRALTLRLALGLLFAAAVIAFVPLGPIVPVLVVVLLMAPPSLFALGAVWLADRDAADDARPPRFDPTLGLELYGLALPLAMLAAAGALVAGELTVSPSLLLAAGTVVLGLGLWASTGRVAPSRRRRPERGSAADKQRAKVVDVGERGPRHEKIAHRRERRIGVVAGE